MFFLCKFPGILHFLSVSRVILDFFSGFDNSILTKEVNLVGKELVTLISKKLTFESLHKSINSFVLIMAL